MANNLLSQVLLREIDIKLFLNWLISRDSTDKTIQTNCSQTEFITYFLNFIHEDCVGKSEVSSKTQPDDADESANKLDDSTRKASTKFDSDTTTIDSTTIHSSVSPLNDTSTPKHRRAGLLCLGDFIATSSSKKKHSKRIKPTSLSDRKLNLENSYNFKGSCEELPMERRFWSKIHPNFATTSNMDCVVKFGAAKPTDEGPNPSLVTRKNYLDIIVVIYGTILVCCYVLNLTSEIYFLITLLKTRFCSRTSSAVDGVDFLDRSHVDIGELFDSGHNVVYFAAKSLQTQLGVVENYDKTTIKLLIDNKQLQTFVPEFVEQLNRILERKQERTVEVCEFQANVCFNSDTDNRQNFPNDQSFSAFRKQRDLFYEILKIWEVQHLQSGWNFSLGLGGKIRTLLALSLQPANFVHFCRLFRAQLLSNYRGTVDDDHDFLSDVDREKLNRLKSRLVTQQSSTGINAAPKFHGHQEFFKDFILTAANYNFNRHLADNFIEEIVNLNSTNFNCSELDGSKGGEVDGETRKLFRNCLKSLMILAKFLGLLESLPYKSDCGYTETILTSHIRIRKHVVPNLEIKNILEFSHKNNRTILCIPWITSYLSMLDYVTLRLPYYSSIITILLDLYRNFHSCHLYNKYLIKFNLGWFFELSHFPFGEYFNSFIVPHTTMITNDDDDGNSNSIGLNNLEMIDQNLLYLCCPYLDEIKRLLLTNNNGGEMNIKHITPVSAIQQSPNAIGTRKLEKQLETAFFRGQPSSLRQTAEFVCERVASACVKYLVGMVVPNLRKTKLEQFRKFLECEFDDCCEQKLIGKAGKRMEEIRVEMRDECRKHVDVLMDRKIRVAVDALLACDVMAQTKSVTVSITKKMCVERIETWICGQVTGGGFLKEFNDEMLNIMSDTRNKSKRDHRKQDKPKFVLPCGGTEIEHNSNSICAAHIVDEAQHLCVRLIENNDGDIQCDDINKLLDDTLISLTERYDVNELISSTICELLLDLALLLVAHRPEMLAIDQQISGKFVKIWTLYFRGTNELFNHILCRRNVMLFAQSKNVELAWTGFAKFCALLVDNDVLSLDNLEGQCTALFRISWDEVTLNYITNYLKELTNLYRENGGNEDRFAFLIGFLSDYCADL